MDEGQSSNELVLSVIVPVRNEEATLAPTLRSLLAQSTPGWVLGEHWELLVVDDASTDRTAEVVRSMPGVTLLEARTPLPKGWTGKANALQTGADRARGQWLLFTEAGTLHAEGSGSRGVIEAERFSVGMLSWAPRRRVSGFLARATMPLVFSELATAYAPAKVNDPASRLAAAAGQCVLVRADALRSLGGFSARASSLIPEVDLAFAAKREKTIGLRFREAPEMVEDRQRHGLAAVWPATVRTLATLLPSALALALWRWLDAVLIWGLPVVALLILPTVGWNSPYLHLYQAVVGLFWLRTLLRIGRRAARSQFRAADLALAVLFGLPVIAALCYASWFRTRILRRVVWKGREYPVGRA